MNDRETYIVKPKDVSEIVRTADPTALEQLMESPLPVIVEAITGFLVSGPKHLMGAAGHIVQGVLKAQMFEQFGKDSTNFVRKGKSRRIL